MSAVRPTALGPAYALPNGSSSVGTVSGSNIDWTTSAVGADISPADQWKQPVVAATTADITIATALNAGDTLDGVTLADGDRVLVKDQSTASGNGVYIVGTTPARSQDFDTGSEVLGAFVYVIGGTANAGTTWYVTNTTTITIDSTSISWAQSGTSIPAGTYVLATDGGEEVVQSHGVTGSTETIDLANGNSHAATLDANCTFTFTGATNGTECSFLLELTEDGTGGWSPTWPGTVVWPGGVAPTHSTTANSVTLYVFRSRDGGATWYGAQVGASGGSPSPLTTKGDLWGYTSADARVSVGTDGYLLNADSTASAGVAYVNPQAIGHYEILMASGTATPLETSDGLDYLYVWVTG